MRDAVKAVMTQLPILPGEYLPGYLARLRHALFFFDNSEFFSITDGVQLGKLDKLFPKAALRFVYLNLTQGQRGKVLHQHLGARYWRGFINENYLDAHVEKELLSKKSRRGIFKGEELLGDLSKPKFCSSCLASDQELYGVALWRATHQLPTVFVCPDHAEPLKCFAIERRSTLLDYPSPQTVPIESIYSLRMSPEHNEITTKSLYLLGQKTEQNRQALQDIRIEVRAGLQATSVGGRVSIKRDAAREWQQFIEKCLNSFEPIQQSSSSLINLRRFHPNEIISDGSLTHPMMFLLLLQFAESYSGTRIL
ncbi:TniQ family protein [Idiomarina abyssalis]|uniref:TniQ family protein n=1 Tax=Idiomarina abyssalis TaxID=86102 RepID=UPI003A91E2B1